MVKEAAAPRRAAKSNGTGLGTGNGGETHQTAAKTDEILTTNQGIPVADNQNSLEERRARAEPS